jgi:putative Holliday junction resolvase
MKPDGRLIGLDLGSRRIGVAVTDSGRSLATALTTIERSGRHGRDHAAVAALVEEYGAVGVIVGLPLSLSGADGPAARQVRTEVEELAEMLEVEVDVVDERLTTVAAAGHLRAAGRSSRRQRRVIDQTAAAGLLQTWVDRDRHRREAQL